MQIKLKIMKMILALLLLTPSISNAGDLVKKDQCLKEDSYVFTIEQAESLKQRIHELEEKEKKIEEYEKLIALLENKISVIKENETLYKELSKNQQQIIKEYEKIVKSNKKTKFLKNVQNYLFFGAGVTLTIFSFMATDYINDTAIND